VNAALFFGAVILRFAAGMLLAKILPSRFLKFEDKNLTAFLSGDDTPAKIITLTANPILPGRTVTEKIMYGNFQASEEELRKAADSVLLPHGMDDVHYLSPSDRQKIALARALLYRPEKIIIAEGLSACDGVTIRRIKAYTLKYYPDIDLT
jgi:ABC-type multidrug transport system fused ATPase/permease subunit